MTDEERLERLHESAVDGFCMNNWASGVVCHRDFLNQYLTLYERIRGGMPEWYDGVAWMLEGWKIRTVVL